MKCRDCGGNLNGDGYRSALACEFLEDGAPDDAVPDSGPYYCGFVDEPAASRGDSSDASAGADWTVVSELLVQNGSLRVVNKFEVKVRKEMKNQINLAEWMQQAERVKTLPRVGRKALRELTVKKLRSIAGDGLSGQALKESLGVASCCVALSLESGGAALHKDSWFPERIPGRGRWRGIASAAVSLLAGDLECSTGTARAAITPLRAISASLLIDLAEAMSEAIDKAHFWLPDQD